jgi:hypothetical protein
VRDLQAADRGRRDAPCHTPPATGDSSIASELTLKRKYRYEGKELSYFNAACPAPAGADTASFPLATANFSLSGGEEIGVTVVKACRVKE